MYRKLFGTLATGIGGAASFYLGQQVSDYRSLQATLRSEADWTPPQRGVMFATNKEWYIFGRQSPQYVRDERKTPKHEEHRKIEDSSLVLKPLGTVMDNEKHYKLFQGSDFEIDLITSDDQSPSFIVPPEAMLSSTIDELNDSALFEVHFARKRGFADIYEKSPFFHSSIALRGIPAGEVPNPDRVIVSGAEIKSILKTTEEKVCKAQHCDLYSSNCYTASVYALGQLITTINARPDVPEEIKSSDIAKVTHVLKGATTDNLARGVSNNLLIRSSIMYDIHPLLVEHRVVTPTKEEKEYKDNIEPPVL